MTLKFSDIDNMTKIDSTDLIIIQKERELNGKL